MIYNYVKAIHIIFIVTWFSGLFYITRLFIYNTEAREKGGEAGEILMKQFTLMIRRLWLGITWPSAVLTLIFGGWMAYLYGFVPDWLWVKLSFVGLLYAYHFTLHKIFTEQRKGLFRFSSMQLRIWNEVATVLLVSIVMLAAVKSSISWLWGIMGVVALILLLLAGIRMYAAFRKRDHHT
jgi:putative membrane protein